MVAKKCAAVCCTATVFSQNSNHEPKTGKKTPFRLHNTAITANNLLLQETSSRYLFTRFVVVEGSANFSTASGVAVGRTPPHKKRKRKLVRPYPWHVHHVCDAQSDYLRLKKNQGHLALSRCGINACCSKKSLISRKHAGGSVLVPR